MKYVLAISGGVDSVVLLDMVAKGVVSLRGESRSNPEKLDRHADKPACDDIVVAHFDHGIRPTSSADAEFVRDLAKKYGLEFYLGRGNLGEKASEESAREKRYKFLRSVIVSLRGESRSNPGKYQLDRHAGKPARDDTVMIVTAHHQDDLSETIIINLLRGTGWRGLSPFWSKDIIRPLLKKTKAEIIDYATKNNLEWVEDETNFSDKYFRNRVRNISSRMTASQRQQLIDLYKKQFKSRSVIEELLCASLQANAKQSRKTGSPRRDAPRDDTTDNTLNKTAIINLPEDLSIEIFRKATNAKLTTPQIKRLIKSLKTAKSGDIFQPGGKLQVGVYKDSITITKICTS